MAGWRTAVIRDSERLSLQNDCLLIEGEITRSIPVIQLREIIIESLRGSITLPLIQFLSANHVSIIFCNEKHLPDHILLGLNTHTDSAGCLMDQAAWQDGAKQKVWANVVRSKIQMQHALLTMKHIEDNGVLQHLKSSVTDGDLTNREGLAAAAYFKFLFGDHFIRHENDAVNSALNYGYSIVLSTACRIIVSHGYNPALGFHHCGRTNPFNLACDIMEPFRPLVDRIVSANIGRELDANYRKELISLIQSECRYGRKRMTLDNAVDSFFLECVKALQDPKIEIKELSFVR